MAVYGGPEIVTDGLILHWDVGNSKSYTSGSSTIYDLSGNHNHGIVTNSYVTYSLDFGGDIAKVAIYSIGLNDSQVLNNYNALKGRYGL